MKADLDRAVGLQPVKDFEVTHCCQRHPTPFAVDCSYPKRCTRDQHGHLTPPDPEPLCAGVHCTALAGCRRETRAQGRWRCY